MNNTLMMNFLVDKENKKIRVEREFNAPLETVWAAWTQSDILDKWWAPKPWRTETKAMNFSEGGQWLYTMVGPEGEVHWCLMKYEKINNKKNYSGWDAFCNKKGEVDRTKPVTYWNNQFVDRKDITVVNIDLSFDELSDLEAIIAMGFKEGFTMGLENLDELLASR